MLNKVELSMRRDSRNSERSLTPVRGGLRSARAAEIAATPRQPKSRKPSAVMLRAPPVLSRRTLQDNVYDYVREGLMVGQFEPGAHLTVRGVAALIGTSVMPVREAIRRLTSEGALEPLSTGATRVPTFDLPKLQDLTEIRLNVEGLATRRAAHRITDQELMELDSLNIEVQKAIDGGDLAAQSKANEHFHFCIYRAAQSSELLRIIENLWLQLGPYLAWVLKRVEQVPTRDRGGRTFRHHKDIVIALRRHDAVHAEAALCADLKTSAAFLIENIGALPSSPK
jgi:DNA-binding GntR family transcriptional regulator